MKKEAKRVVLQPLKVGVAKVPLVIQLEALECGAACLTMVLAYYGKWLPLEQIRADCGVSRDGSNALHMLRAGRSYGLLADGYRYGVEALREKGTFPCIIHWEMNHFVVLCGFKGDKAIISDPAKGNYAVSMDRFDRSYTGICLCFAPGESFEPSGKPKSMLAFARRKLIGAGAAFGMVVATTVIASLLGIIAPGMANVFADRLLTRTNPEWFRPFMLGMVALGLVQIVVTWVKTVYTLKVNGKMAIVGNGAYMWHVLRLPMAFFSQRMTGDISGRRQKNAGIAQNLIGLFAPLVIQAFMMLFYLFVMLRYSPLLSLLGILSIAGSGAVSAWISRKRVNLTRVASRDSGNLAGATVSGIEMIESIKASGAENGFFRKWSGYQASVNTDQMTYARLNTYLGLIPAALSALTNVLVLMGGVALCMRGQWTVGMITAFSGFLGSFMAPAMQLVTASQTLQEMRADMERIEDVMAYPTDVEDDAAHLPEDVHLQKLSGRVELRHVTFGYSRLDKPVIEDFSMTMTPGQQVAIVGASGCGKSTIAKLIAGLYKPWSGEILLDGKPLADIPHSVVTSSLSVVDQDIILFEDTIANNIKMWDTAIEDFEMILAARDAQIHGDIMQRDGGYQGRITEGGSDLSGGQRQRLEIARVLAQDPSILILDEATSALDAQTEFDVVKAIRDRGVTCIAVAHRLSTIRDCDEIIVLDHGRVVERGTHAALYRQGGVYTQLVTNE